MIGRLDSSVIGAGLFGELHARAYAESDSVELAVGVDPNVKAGLHVARRYGARHAKDVGELLEDDSIQTYTVVMPDRMHVAVASQILEPGRAVLLEKPMADTLEWARRISLAAERGGGRLATTKSSPSKFTTRCEPWPSTTPYSGRWRADNQSESRPSKDDSVTRSAQWKEIART